MFKQEKQTIITARSLTRIYRVGDTEVVGLKNIDLVGEFGADEGFWKSFSDGVENIQVEDGRIRVRLRE